MDIVEIQGEAVPALGLGTWRMSGGECRRAVEEALELGYRHLDTAQMYANERDVGAGLEESGVAREDVFVTTKIDNDNHAPDAVRRSTEQSLDDLRLDHVDLLLVHWPVEWETMDRTLATMHELQQDGLARRLGVSNFTPAQLRDALGMAPLFALQVEHHPYLAQRELRELCVEHDLLFTAYSPVAKGRVTDDPLISEIADAHGCTSAQVTLRWLLDQPHVAAIPKASKREHIEENWALDFELTDEDRARIDALDEDHHLVDPSWAPGWGS